jgi:hypothetical protein
MVLGGEKIPILEERAQRHSSRGRNAHKGSMSDVSSSLHQSDIPCSKGERLFKGIQIGGAIPGRDSHDIQVGGAAPRRVQAGGAAPRGE